MVVKETYHRCQMDYNQFYCMHRLRRDPLFPSVLKISAAAVAAANSITFAIDNATGITRQASGMF